MSRKTNIDVDFYSDLDHVDKSIRVVPTLPDSQTLGELMQKLPTAKYDKPKFLFEWDDTVQFISLGVMYLISLTDDTIRNEMVRFDREKFFNRSQIDGREFVYEYFKGRFTPEELINFEKSAYQKLIVFSPRSHLYQFMFKWSTLFNEIGIVFRNTFESGQLLADLQKHLCLDTPPRVFFLDQMTKKDVANSYDADVVVSNDIGSYFNSYSMERKREYMTYIGTYRHCGLSDDFIALYLNQDKRTDQKERFGPSFSKFDFYEEIIDGN